MQEYFERFSHVRFLAGCASCLAFIDIVDVLQYSHSPNLLRHYCHTDETILLQTMSQPETKQKKSFASSFRDQGAEFDQVSVVFSQENSPFIEVHCSQKCKNVQHRTFTLLHGLKEEWCGDSTSLDNDFTLNSLCNRFSYCGILDCIAQCSVTMGLRSLFYMTFYQS